MDRDLIRSSLLGLCGLWRRRWRWALPAVLIGLALGGTLLRGHRNPWRATSVLVVRNAPGLGGGMGELLAAAGFKGAVGGGGSGGTTISLEALARQVQSRFQWPATQRRLRNWRGRNGERLAAPLSEDQYYGALAVDTQGGDQLLVRGISLDRAIAMAVSETAARVAEEASIEDARSDWKRVVSYAEQVLPTLEREMNKANQRMADYQRRARVYDAANATKTLAQTLSDNLGELYRAQARAAGAREQFERLRDQAKREDRIEVVSVPLEDPVVHNLRTELGKAQAELIRARAEFQPSAPEIAAAQDQVEESEKLLRDHLGKSITVAQGQNNPRWQLYFEQSVKSQTELLGAQATVAAYSQVLQENRREMEDLTVKLAQWQGLAQQSKVKESSYMVFLAKLQEATINAAVQPGNLRLVDLAGGAQPTGLPRDRMILFTILGSLLLGYLAALLADSLDDAVVAPAEAQRAARAPVLGSLPTARGSEPALAVLHQPNSPLAEAARTLGVAVKQTGTTAGGRVVLVTSPERGDGKTTVAANLALALAGSGQRVVLVDVNLRAPALARLFQAPEGLARVLLNDDPLAQVLHGTALESLKVLATSARVAHPSELIESPRWTRLLDELRREFAVVVLDAPPLLDLAEARVLAQRADVTLLVARSGRTTRTALTSARQILDSVHAPLHGLVLNHSRSGDRALAAAPRVLIPMTGEGERTL